MTPKIEDCAPGLKPMGYNVLVALDVVEEKTAGGIIVPEKFKERTDSAMESGVIVSASPMAFSGGDWAAIPSDKHPQVGQSILFQRYAGTEFKGADDKKYRIVADTDIKGVFDA